MTKPTIRTDQPNPSAGEQVGEHDREDDGADGGTCDGDAHGGAAALVEPLGHGGERREHDEPVGEPGEDPLGEHEVPVPRADARHHYGEYIQDGGGAYHLGGPWSVYVKLKHHLTITIAGMAWRHKHEFHSPMHRNDQTAARPRRPWQT